MCFFLFCALGGNEHNKKKKTSIIFGTRSSTTLGRLEHRILDYDVGCNAVSYEGHAYIDCEKIGVCIDCKTGS